MLRALGTSTNPTGAETKNKLLDADANQDDDPATTAEGTEQGEEESESEVPESSIGAVITQFTGPPSTRPALAARTDDIDGKPTWKSKFRYGSCFSLISLFGSPLLFF